MIGHTFYDDRINLLSLRGMPYPSCESVVPAVDAEGFHLKSAVSNQTLYLFMDCIEHSLPVEGAAFKQYGEFRFHLAKRL